MGLGGARGGRIYEPEMPNGIPGGRKEKMGSEENGSTALHVSSQEGHFEIAMFLAEQGGEELLFMRTNIGHTCLHRAAQRGHARICEWFCKEKRGGQLMMMKDRLGRTALHTAAEYGHFDVVKVLAMEGGDKLLNIKDKRGRTALDVAAKEGFVTIVECIKNKDFEYESTLVEEIKKEDFEGHLDVTRSLKDAGGRHFINIKPYAPSGST
jgi:ankyrin repeat protein